MQSLLETTDSKFTIPNRGTADLTPLTYKQITFPEGIAIVFRGRDIHYRQIRRIDTIPLHIDIPQINKMVATTNAFGIRAFFLGTANI